MILSFLVGGELVRVKVDKERNLSMSSRHTNNEFLPFKKMVEASGQEGKDADITERRLKCESCLPGKEDVEHYVKDEFMKNPELRAIGIEYLGKEDDEPV